ncbi:DUF6054 family protein [Priestia koreensis]|uniref:DUF6054 family protein n=1 Tax=Priestia koreensis TaxID=284581 RepID=UPI0030163147
MAKYEKAIIGQFDEVVERLDQDISNSGISMKLVDETNYTLGDAKVAVRVYDKYFMRNGNRASLSLTVVGHDQTVFVSAIGAGGGQGIFLNFSLGAEDDMVRIVRSSLEGS